MVNRLQVLFLMVLIPLGALYFYAQEEGTTMRGVFTSESVPIIHVGDIPIRVEIVDSPNERAKGLSGRSELKDVEGMLFVFDAPDRHGMWMKEMRFPIDIIWISKDLVVVGVERAVSPDTYPKQFFAPSPALYAIETNARYAETFGIDVGDTVRLPLQLERAAKEKVAK